MLLMREFIQQLMLKKFKQRAFLLCATILISGSLLGQENCTNGIDDDGDGLVDLNDTEDCFCEGSSGGEIESIIPNPSFEEMDDCCPNNYSQLYCAEDWVQATNATSDYFNTCDYMPACIPTPLPDGEGVVGAYFASANASGNPWYEYIGACLESDMIAGESYTLQFDLSAIYTVDFDFCSPIPTGPVDVTLFGLESCPDFPVNTSSCPVGNGWSVLGSVNYQPVEEWAVMTINFVPDVNISAVMLGPPCDLDLDEFDPGPGGELLYCIFDDLILNESSLFSGIINQEGGNCLGDLILSSVDSDIFTYQWYHEGIALAGETNWTLNLGETGYDIGDYQVLISNLDDETCTIASTTVSPEESSPVQFEADVLSGCVPLEVNFTNLTDPDFIQSSEWNFEIGNSSANNPTFTFDEPGFFDITLTITTPGNCTTSITLDDYIEVFDTESPEVNVTVLDNCSPFSVAFTSNAPAGSTCEWDFEDFGIFNECNLELEIAETGTYFATIDVSGIAGCSEPGNFSFDVLPGDPPSFSLEGPSSICSGSTDSLHAVFENGSIEWGDGSSGAFYEIMTPGTYKATFTHDNGCIALDSIFIPEKLPPVLRVTDKEACEGDPVQLFAESVGAVVRWPDISDDPVAVVYEPGVYLAEAENECGISQKEAEVKLIDCNCEVYVPNAFTPDGNGINDLFKPSISCDLQFYEIIIFDRWGRKVFHSDDPDLGWNGSTVQNTEHFSQSQIYNYIIRYDNALRPNSDRQEIKGFVQLMR